MKIIKRFRDAVRGRFVRKDYADANPSTTIGETVRSDKTDTPLVDNPEMLR